MVDGQALRGQGAAEEGAQEGVERRHAGGGEFIMTDCQARGRLGALLGGGELVGESVQNCCLIVSVEGCWLWLGCCLLRAWVGVAMSKGLLRSCGYFANNRHGSIQRDQEAPSV